MIRSVSKDRVQAIYTPLSISWTASGQDRKVSLPKGCFLEKLRYHLCSKTLSFSWSWRGKIWVTIPLDMQLGTERRKENQYMSDSSAILHDSQHSIMNHF